MNIEITNTFHFEAAHHLPGLPEDHKCRGLHGHTWTVRIFVTGPINNTSGMIVDYAELAALWADLCHPFLDHCDLNDTIDNPTTENIAAWIYVALREAIDGLDAYLTRVEIDEGADGGSCILTAPPLSELTKRQWTDAHATSPDELVARYQGLRNEADG